MQTHIHLVVTGAVCLALGARPEEAVACGFFATTPDWLMALQTVVDIKNGVAPLQNRPHWLKRTEEPAHSIPLWATFFILCSSIYVLTGWPFLILAPAIGLLSHVLLDRLFHGDPKIYPLAKNDPTMFWPFKVNMDKFFAIKILGRRIFTHDYRRSEGLKIIPEKRPERVVMLAAVAIIILGLTV